MFEAFMPQAQDPNVAGPSLEELRKRKLMAELLQGRRGPPKIEHPLQGVAHILDSAFDGYREKRERQRSQAEATQANQMMAQFLAGSGGPTAPAPSAAPAPPAPTAPSATGTAPAAPTASPASLIQSESGGDWGARNSVPRRDGTVGHFGRLQFSQPRLAEAAAAGAIPQGTTPQAFMASPELQQAAERWHFADIDKNIRERGLDRYVGQTINGVPVTLEGMRAVAHLGGNQGLARFLESGGRYNPQDANGTSLLNYLQRHGSQRRAEAPADTLSGSDGMEEPPLVDGRNLPPDTQAPALDRPAMSFDEAMPPADPAPPAPITAGPDPQALAQVLFSAPVPEPRPPMPAPSVDNMMAGDQVVPQGAPMQAPVPEPRPPTPAPSVDNMMAGDQVVPQGAPMQAPMPQPRPNLEPPPQAMPAGPAPQPQAIAQALAPQMNERDRLMLLRDEQSLAPGEADRLRQGLPNPQAIAAVMQGRPLPQATPAPGPAQMPAQQPPQPQGMPQQMQAPQGMPPGGPQAMPQMQGPPGQIPDQLLLRMMNNPQTRPFAMQEIQRRQQQNTPQAQAQLRRDQAQAAIAERDASGRAPTPRITEYEFYARQARERGATPDPFEVWDRANRRDGANSTTVNTGGSDKQIFDAVNESATAARSAATGLVAIQQARRAVEGGGIFGAGADMRLGLQKVASQLGLANPESVINTETFQAAIAPQVAAMLKATVGTANISNSDREFAERAAGGRISLDQGSITRLLDIMERGNRTVLETHQKRLDTIYPPTGPHQRERALFGVEVPQAPAGGPRRISSQEEFNSLPSGTEFVAPDGTVRRKP